MCALLRRVAVFTGAAVLRATQKGPRLACTTPSVAPGASLTFTVIVQVGAHAKGTVQIAAGHARMARSQG